MALWTLGIAAGIQSPGTLLQAQSISSENNARMDHQVLQSTGSQLSGEKKTKKRLPVSSANGSERGSCRTRTRTKMKMKAIILWDSQDSRHSSA